MFEMAEFMGQHARDFVGVVGLRQQSVEQIDLAARQREGIWNRLDSTPDCTEVSRPADSRIEVTSLTKAF